MKIKKIIKGIIIIYLVIIFNRRVTNFYPSIKDVYVTNLEKPIKVQGQVRPKTGNESPEEEKRYSCTPS